MRLWKWLLIVSTGSIFIQIVLAGLMFLGLTNLHTGLPGVAVFFLLVVTAIVAWRAKAGRRMLGLLGIIFVLFMIQVFLGGGASTRLEPTDLALVAHGVNALILYTLTLAVTISAVRRPD